MKNLYWQRLDKLIKTSEIVIDHPKGTAHQKYPNLIFPLDYGYLKNTTAMDGDGIDLWIGTAKHRKLTAIVCTIDNMKKDAEVKLLIGCTEEDINTIMQVHNGKYMSGMLVRREEK
jgi:inorganic pyrophosphatase